MTKNTQLVLDLNGKEYIHTFGIPVTIQYARAYCRHILPQMTLKQINNPAPVSVAETEHVWRS